MKLLAATTITFTSQRDPVTAMLSSDLLLVPCDSQGGPRIPLGSSPLTSRMTIIQDGVMQTGWTFSITQQGVSASVDTTGLVSVTGISADNGVVEVTASKEGNASLVKDLVVTKVYQGEMGESMKALTLYASQSVISYSSRGELNTQEIEITCVPSNLSLEEAVWTATDEGSLSPLEIADGVFSPNKQVLDCSLVSGDSTLVTVTVETGGQTYTGMVGITKVAEGAPKPMYLNALQEVPTITEEGPLVVGDFFLYTGPYTGAGSDPGDVGINAPYASPNEFICGRIYEYKGNSIWEESRKSDHLSAAQKDALQIAKDTGTYMYVAVLVAQLGLFQDLLIAALLRSTNYSENAEGVPTAGFMLDGIRGLIKVLGLEAYSAFIYGNLEASGFRTLQEEAGTTIAVTTISPSLWKFSEMTDLLPDQDSLEAISGTINGFSFTKATRRTNARILLASHGYEHEDITAGEGHHFTELSPSPLFGSSFFVEYSGYYDGYSSVRGYMLKNSNYPMDSVSQSLSTSYKVAKTYSIPAVPPYIAYVYHTSQALWGTKGSYVNYHRIWTNQAFSGLVLVNGDDSYHTVAFEPNAYYKNSKTWQIGSVTQANKDNYCSGTDFYNLFSALSVGSDGFCDGGQVNINGTLYNVTRLIKNANSITLHTSSGIISVTKFQEGSAVGVYTQLAVTQAIKFQAIAGGIEVKHIFPWGSQSGSPGNYDIGTSNERFSSGYFRYLDVLNQINGKYISGSASNGYKNFIPTVGSDGVMEVGKYMDWHMPGSNNDYDQRIESLSDRLRFQNIEVIGSEGFRSAGNRQWGSFGGGVTTSTSFTKVGNTLRFKKGGVFTFYFGLAAQNPSKIVYARIYKNGVGFGTQRGTKNGSYVYYSENLTISGGDIISIYARTTFSYTGYGADVTAVRVSQNEEGNEV
ncbi:hypothetical protein [uncultured Sphaerochaeta sp.]|uniref:hypothetical protein n=1 Tax=uncultured Sphaerochaeta sp. TaxID=886478 RepID=UPI002AA8A9D7|nr:hypothetical protein [uncultured Sphaerochaeta sp.]